MADVTVISDGSADAERLLEQIRQDYSVRPDGGENRFVVEVPGSDELEAHDALVALLGDFPYGRAPVTIPYPAS
jgi:hypothetical protein